MNRIVEQIEAIAVEIEERGRENLLVKASAEFKDSPFSETAAEAVEEYLKDHPGDPVALHHLAIHHHAYAFSLDAEDGDFAPAFQEAIRRWRDLYVSDAFWHRLRKQAEQHPNDRFEPTNLEETRRSLPQYLLETHANTAVDCFIESRRKRGPDCPEDYLRSCRQRAAACMSIVTTCPAEFSKVSEQLRNKAFDDCKTRLVGDGDGNPDLKHELSICRAYLKIDPDCRDANLCHVRIINDLVVVSEYPASASLKTSLSASKSSFDEIKDCHGIEADLIIARRWALESWPALGASPTAAGKRAAMALLNKCWRLCPNDPLAAAIKQFIDNFYSNRL